MKKRPIPACTAMDDTRFKPKRLTKQPPASASTSTATITTTAGMNPPNPYGTHLYRQPSSSQSPVSSHTSHDHYQRTPTSSNSSLDRSPNPAGAQYPSTPATTTTATATDPYAGRRRYSTRQSLDEQFQEPHPGVLSSLDSTKATGYQNSLRRPGPPPLSHTNSSSKITSPLIRHSSSFSLGDRPIISSPSDPESHLVAAPSKRYSDEANGGKTSTPWKKKSGISSFIGSVLGSPRASGPKISAPENPVHVTHVGFDNDTGQFTV